MRSLQRVAAIAVLLVAPGFAGAAGAPTEIWPATAFGGYHGVRLVEASWQQDAPAWTRASRVDVTFGAISDPRETLLFGVVAPVWSLLRSGQPVFAEFSIGPTILDGSTVAGRELGGKFHFRSSLAVGIEFGRQHRARLALRVSHISNGGIRATNPGLDYVGLSVAIRGNGARVR